MIQVREYVFGKKISAWNFLSAEEIINFFNLNMQVFDKLTDGKDILYIRKDIKAEKYGYLFKMNIKYSIMILNLGL